MIEYYTGCMRSTLINVANLKKLRRELPLPEQLQFSTCNISSTAAARARTIPHYAPLFCDMALVDEQHEPDLRHILALELSALYKSLQQLLAVMPCASNVVLPGAFRELSKTSLIRAFYPGTFTIDMDLNKSLPPPGVVLFDMNVGDYRARSRSASTWATAAP